MNLRRKETAAHHGKGQWSHLLSQREMKMKSGLKRVFSLYLRLLLPLDKIQGKQEVHDLSVD